MIRDQFENINDLWLQPWVKYWRKKEKQWFLLKPQMKAIVDPISKAKTQDKVRGRKCVVLYIFPLTDIVGIMYLDTKKYGERSCTDLIPLPAEVINLDDRRKEKS